MNNFSFAQYVISNFLKNIKKNSVLCFNYKIIKVKSCQPLTSIVQY